MEKSDGSGKDRPVRISRSSTLIEQAYSVLKQRITTGAYTGGAHLVERQLAEEFGISKTPVREALARLEKERLVDFEPGRGMRVRVLDALEVEHILELRELLEGFAAEKAALAADETQIERMARILEESRHISSADAEAYKDLDEAFHAEIRRASRNGTLAHMMMILRDQVRLVMTTTSSLPGRRAASVIEHSRILEAIEARDAEAAGARAREHMRNARAAVKEHAF